MAVSTNIVARRYIDVAADQAISVDIPIYEASDVRVFYGSAVLMAVQNSDYTVALAQDFETVTITVKAALVAKIDALIAADRDEVNAVVVRRVMNYLTEATPAGVRHTPFTSREFDRAAMRDQQLADSEARAVKLGDNFATPYPDVSVKHVPSSLADRPALVFLPDGGLGGGPSTSEIAGAQTAAQTATTQAGKAAASASTAADRVSEAEAARDAARRARDQTEGAIDALPTGMALQGNTGKFLRVNDAELRYEIVSSVAGFYGLKVENWRLKLDKEDGIFAADDYAWSGVHPAGLAFSINDSGHLVVAA